MVRAEDQRRICAVNEKSENARVIRRDIAFILAAARIPRETVKIHVCENPGYASAATTLDTLILTPGIAGLPRHERLYVLAHEVGHLANRDADRWGSLDTLEINPTEQAVWDASRDMEIGADRWAATIMQTLGVDPVQAAASFFFHRGILDLPGTVSHPSAKVRLAAMAVVTDKPPLVQ